jgi:hypothetical protein
MQTQRGAFTWRSVLWILSPYAVAALLYSLIRLILWLLR